MKKKLVTIATIEIAPFAFGFLANQKDYAEANGYDYEVVTTRHWKDMHPSFSKVHEIHRALQEGWDTVLWADADVLFTNYTVDLDDLLSPGVFLAAYQQGNWSAWKYLCAGLTVWKNTNQAKRFVDEWMERVEIGSPRVRPNQRVIIPHHPWEQWYFDEIIRETNHVGTRGCTAAEIGCFCAEIWHDGTLWVPGMPTIHMAGPATWQQRAELLPRYLPHVVYK